MENQNDSYVCDSAGRLGPVDVTPARTNMTYDATTIPKAKCDPGLGADEPTIIERRPEDSDRAQ